MGKTFYLAHGDGLGPGDKSYKFLKAIFEFRPNQFLFRWLHPDIGAWMGNYFSRRSRLAKLSRAGKIEPSFKKEQEMLYIHAKDMAKEFPEVDYFVFGHRHMPIITNINPHAQLVILGDWISHFSYGKYDGKSFILNQFGD